MRNMDDDDENEVQADNGAGDDRQKQQELPGFLPPATAAPKFGLQPTTLAVCMDRENDYCLEYFRNMECWIRPVHKTPAHTPWIEADKLTWERSYALKYINYEAEPGSVNLDNPLQMTEENELKMRISKKKGKGKKKGVEGDFSVTEEGVVEVQKEDADDDISSDEDEDFLDAYGNVIDPSQKAAAADSVGSEASTDATKTVSSRGGARSQTSSKKKKKKNRSKKKGGNPNDPIPRASSKEGYRDLDGGTTSQIDSSSRHNSSQAGRSRVPTLKKEEPRASSLSHKEQMLYLGMMAKFTGEEGFTSVNGKHCINFSNRSLSF
jgi:hypothetical protein